MSTDRELLELAAVAVGIKARWFRVSKWRDTGTSRIMTGKAEVFGTHHSKPWNPLTDDGDALRLAVKLKMLVDVNERACEVICSAKFDITERILSDPLAATRRAIVRAAAEIGRSMP